MFAGYRRIALAMLIAFGFMPGAQAVTGEQLAAKTKVASIGQFAPRATLDTVDGRSIDLGEFYGHRPVYLKFWATWCIPCREQMPHFEHAQQQYGKDMAVVAINLGLNDDVDDVRRFLQNVHLTMPVAIDSAGQLAETFGVVVTPMHVLIDADGKVAYVGHEAGKELDAALDAVAHSQPHANLQRAVRQSENRQRPVGVGDQAPPLPNTTEARQVSVIEFTMTSCESYLKDSRPAVSAACRNSRLAISKSYAASTTAPAKSNWIAVASRVWTTDQDLESYRAKYGVAHPVILDTSGELFRRYGIRQVPTVVIVGADGVIRERFEGYGPELDAALERVAH
jgi:peroxiredoxin